MVYTASFITISRKTKVTKNYSIRIDQKYLDHLFDLTNPAPKLARNWAQCFYACVCAAMIQDLAPLIGIKEHDIIMVFLVHTFMPLKGWGAMGTINTHHIPFFMGTTLMNATDDTKCTLTVQVKAIDDDKKWEPPGTIHNVIHHTKTRQKPRPILWEKKDAL